MVYLKAPFWGSKNKLGCCQVEQCKVAQIPKKNVWRLITHDLHPFRDVALNWYRTHHLIALGWGDIGDLRLHQLHNREGIVNLYWDTYGNTGNNNNCGSCKRSLWRLWREMKIDDLVILVTRHRVCVVRVVGDYSFDRTYPISINAQDFGEYWHRREIEVAGTAEDADDLWNQHTPEPSTVIFDALIRLAPR